MSKLDRQIHGSFEINKENILKWLERTECFLIGQDAINIHKDTNYGSRKVSVICKDLDVYKSFKLMIKKTF